MTMFGSKDGGRMQSSKKKVKIMEIEEEDLP
jgi:hypothetical protein